ncbi:hypothetical protein [Pseudomonas sp. S9]|uniref:hypothetical protein n=1 Tax=Pseudomonas sp. S9 TaxID=686578 RepID=UPI0002556DBE|nr:hypothetical protein [Pseudomonas sp. S9]
MSELIEARRKAFEAEYQNDFGYEWRDDGYYLPEKAKYKRSELFQHQMYLYAFHWFCKALESVVVELPAHSDQDLRSPVRGFANGRNSCIDDCAEAIHAAGIKTKVMVPAELTGGDL